MEGFPFNSESAASNLRCIRYSLGYASFQANLAVAISERIVHRVVSPKDPHQYHLAIRHNGAEDRNERHVLDRHVKTALLRRVMNGKRRSTRRNRQVQTFNLACGS